MARRAKELADTTSPRAILGITGAPGAGKSTLAERLVGDLGSAAAVVAMDGFHLANAELDRLGRSDVKGAVDTFDGDGYVALLRRLRDEAHRTVYVPRYERAIEEAIAGAVAVGPDVRLVVTEGNYLLADTAPWDAVRPLLDEVWYCDLDDAERRDRLVRRHRRYGRSETAAAAFVQRSDDRNARLVSATRARADLVVELGPDGGGGGAGGGSTVHSDDRRTPPLGGGDRPS